VLFWTAARLDSVGTLLDRLETSLTYSQDPCGTARLSKSIYQGVVDSKLRVHGIRNLRIADASVIPVIPDCRIQNSVYMIGEKVSINPAIKLLQALTGIIGCGYHQVCPQGSLRDPGYPLLCLQQIVNIFDIETGPVMLG
jgi:hypothetical protein